MRPHLVLQEEIVFRWAEEIAREMEEDTVLLLKYDPVISAWGELINEVIPMVKIRSTCARIACPKACRVCVSVKKTLCESKGKDVCINCKSVRLLFIKIRDIRYLPIKNISIDKKVIDLFTPDKSVFIVDADESKVYLPPKIYKFIKEVDELYCNPVLIVQMVKYLEFEKTKRRSECAATENDPAVPKSTINLVIHGLKVSFLYDPIVIESSRMSLYRKNNKLQVDKHLLE